MRTLSNSEDPDEMQHNATLHLRLHCLLSSETELHYDFDKSTSQLAIYMGPIWAGPCK